MGRLKRLEDRITALEDVLKNMTFVSDAPVVTVQVPVPILDSNNNPTGDVTTGYLQIKTGPTSGELKLRKGNATISVQ